MQRRELLSLLGVTIAGGCLGRGANTPTETGRSTTPSPHDPVGTDEAAKSCASDKVLVTAYLADIDSSINGFEISPGQQAVHPGHELTIKMRNTGDERRETGNRSTYDIQRRISGQWRSIFWRDPEENVIFDADAIAHEPGEGFTWTLQMTREALRHEIENGQGTLHVCSSIEPGLYRFVFHGASKYDESGTELQAHLGTQFAVFAE